MRSLFILGQDVGDEVTDWGEFEEVKEVLLAQAQMFVGQISVRLKNTNGAFSPSNPLGLLGGVGVYGLPVSLVFDGVTVYSGVLRDVVEDYATKSVTLVIQNALTGPSETAVDLVASGLNPALAILTLLQQVLPASQIDAAAFLGVAGVFDAAGATVGCNYTTASKKTMLQSVQDISALGGFSVFALGPVVTCRPGISRQSVKQVLDGKAVKAFGQKSLAYEFFANQVGVGWGASATFTATDQASLRANGLKTYAFSTNTGSDLYVSDAGSAQFFADAFLARCANIRTEITLDVDEYYLNDVTLGDVYGITAPLWYLDQVPFEVLEVHRVPKEFKISLVMATLPR